MYAIVRVDYSGAETVRLNQFEIVSQAGSECGLAAAHDHRVDKHVTFVDQIRGERKARQLRAANVDVVRRFPLELPNSLDVEFPLDTGIARRSGCQRS